MTAAERAILVAIRDHHARRGFGPSLRELGRAAYVSERTASDRVRELEAAGLVGRIAKCARNVWLTEAGLAAIAERSE
jgi:DNA-binding MarR family transcriptional regulator